MIAVCSNKPRAATKTGKGGAHWWKREVYHLVRVDEKLTLCGRDRSEWLTIGPISSIDAHCCAYCARLFEQPRV